MPARVPTTTSRSVCCASRGTNGRRRNHYEGSRSYRAIRGGTRRREIHRRGNHRRVTATPVRRVGEAWLEQHSSGQ